MIYGIGTDIIEVELIQKVMERDIGFRDKIFTTDEIEYCETKKNKCPAIILKSVDFPHPDGPRMQMNSPCPISRLISASAMTSRSSERNTF